MMKEEGIVSTQVRDWYLAVCRHSPPAVGTRDKGCVVDQVKVVLLRDGIQIEPVDLDCIKADFCLYICKYDWHKS